MRRALLCVALLVWPVCAFAQQDQTLADIRQELTVLYVEIQRLNRELSTLMDSTHSHLVFRTKGWEPPLLEFNDFLEALIRLHPTITIVIQPLALPGSALTSDELTAWRSTIAKLGTSQIYVAEPQGQEA